MKAAVPRAWAGDLIGHSGPITGATFSPDGSLVATISTDNLGKSVGRALLRVRFRGEAGEDAAAWLVADPERWQREIAARSGARPAPPRPD